MYTVAKYIRLELEQTQRHLKTNFKIKTVVNYYYKLFMERFIDETVFEMIFINYISVENSTVEVVDLIKIMPLSGQFNDSSATLP